MSLRVRLLLAATVVALIALLVADVVTYASLRTFLRNHIDSSLESSHVAVEASLTKVGDNDSGKGSGKSNDNDSDDRASLRRPSGAGSSGNTSSGNTSSGNTSSGGGTSAPITSEGFCSAITGLAPGIFAEVRTPSGRIVGSDDCPAIESGGNTFSPMLPRTISGFHPTGVHHEPTVYFSTAATSAKGPEFEVRVSKLQSGPHAGDELVLAQSLNTTIKTLDRLILIEGVVTGAGLAVAVLLGWWLVRLGLRPLGRVERTAEAIARGDLTERVPGASSRTEVGQVALALNVMLDNIEGAFAERDATEAELRSSEERLRRFVADASHELRTPVAAISAYAELFERTDRDDRELPRITEGIADETRRMGHLVEDLLLLARLDEGRPIAVEPVELVDLASTALETARTVGPDWPVMLEASGAVEVLGDQAQLRQVVDNLLGNVRSHTPAGTRTTVRVAEEGGEGIVEVADEGPGLSPEEASQVFRRFYRADPSRARSSGGAGLGLSIVSSIVEAHGGTVSVSSKGSGTIFTVRLPLAEVPAEP